MFTTVENEFYIRLNQCRILLQQIDSHEGSEDEFRNDLSKIEKGLFFVSLYSTVEYTVVSLSQTFLSNINSDDKTTLDFKNNMICVVLDGKFDSIRNCGKRNLWKKREELVEELFNDDTDIVNTILPTDGSNIGYSQLVDIWNFFCLPEPVLANVQHQHILNEIKEHRNAIAHGRKTAAEIGSRYTHNDLKRKYDAVEEMVLHVLSKFKIHVSTKGYLRAVSATT